MTRLQHGDTVTEEQSQFISSIPPSEEGHTSLYPQPGSHLPAERQAEPLRMGPGQAGRGPRTAEPPPLQHGHVVTQRLSLIQVVGGEDDRPTCDPGKGASDLRGTPGVHPLPPVEEQGQGWGVVSRASQGFQSVEITPPPRVRALETPQG